MIVGALGVAMAMHAHLQQKMDNIAVMKSLGAASRDIIGIYTLQTLMLGLVGGLAGVVVGRIVERTLPLLISRFFHMDIKLGWNLAASAQGIAVGMLTTLLFTLPPLLAIRKMRPAMILRRDMPEAKMTWSQAARRTRGLSRRGGRRDSAGDRRHRGVARGFAARGRILRRRPDRRADFARAGRRRIPAPDSHRVCSGRRGAFPTLARQGFANLYRQGNQAQAILVALGLGVMFTLTVYLVQHSLVGEIVQSAPPDAPNVFLIGITPEQVGPLKTLIAKQKGVVAQPEFAPSVAVRIEKV